MRHQLQGEQRYRPAFRAQTGADSGGVQGVADCVESKAWEAKGEGLRPTVGALAGGQTGVQADDLVQDRSKQGLRSC